MLEVNELILFLVTSVMELLERTSPAPRACETTNGRNRNENKMYIVTLANAA